MSNFWNYFFVCILGTLFIGQGIKPLEATQQDQYLEMSGSGKTTTFKITVVVKKCAYDLSFNNLWIDNNAYQLTVLSTKKNTDSNYFEKGDTLYLVARRVEGEIPVNVQNSIPKKCKNKKVIEYSLCRKHKYLEIKAFEELKPIYHQY